MNSKLIVNLEYRLIKKQGEGTFSEVFKAQSIKTGAYVAIKCMKSHFATQEQVSYLLITRLTTSERFKPFAASPLIPTSSSCLMSFMTNLPEDWH